MWEPESVQSPFPGSEAAAVAKGLFPHVSSFTRTHWPAAPASGPLHARTWLLKSSSGEIPTISSPGGPAVWPGLCPPVVQASRVTGEKTQAGQPVRSREEGGEKSKPPSTGGPSSLAVCSLQVSAEPAGCQALCWEGLKENSSSPVCRPSSPQPPGPRRPTLRSLCLLTWGWPACFLSPGSGGGVGGQGC